MIDSNSRLISSEFSALIYLTVFKTLFRDHESSMPKTCPMFYTFFLQEYLEYHVYNAFDAGGFLLE